MLSLSLKEVLTRIKNGQLSSCEVFEKCVNRAKKLRELNFFITETFDNGTEKTLHQMKAQKDGKLNMLPGIPFAVKDNFCTRSIRTTCASNMLKNYIPPYNATVVQRLLDQGARIIGKTNMDEFAMGATSIESIFGPVRNPWKYNLLQTSYPVPSECQKTKVHQTVGSTDDSCSSQKSYSRNFSTAVSDISERLSNCTKNDNGQHQECSLNSDWFISGGSSGGSAVAVAAGTCYGALGSDTGGSTRNPASYCGVVGLKSTYGRLSRYGLIPLTNSLDVPGIFAKTVDDAAIIFNTLAGHDIQDSTTVTDPFHPVILPDMPEVKGLTIGIPQNHDSLATREVIDLRLKVADMFANAGAKVVPVFLPHASYSLSCYIILCCSEVASNMACYDGIEFGHRAKDTMSTEQLFATTRHDGFNDVVRERILAGNYFLLKSNFDQYVLKAMQVRRLIRDDYMKVFSSGIDLLLTPTTSGDAPLYQMLTKEENHLRTGQQDLYTAPINLAGIPAITVPTALSKNGLPIGLQLIGQDFKEQEMLSAAKWLEQEMNFPYLDLSFLDDINT